MLDFLLIAEKETKDKITVYPKFIVNPSTKDLMLRGGDFYAVWDADAGMWSTKESSVIEQVDRELELYKLRMVSNTKPVSVSYMWDSDSGSIDRWHKYVQRQMRDCYKPLDEKVIFSNTKVVKEDYTSKRLPYPLKKGSIESYEELVDTLYSEDNRRKFEWAIGAIISGDAKRIQKFEVFYGSAGTGKSTVLNIIGKLFDGYTSTFSAKELASASNPFALESFKDNPLVSIQHDGDLSRIEDNTKLNSIVSHETMEVNAKYTRIYTTRFNTFLFMGTNKPVKITEAKSGLLRRLIDVRPTGKKLPFERYSELWRKIDFELGAIAYHCLKVYEELGESYYDNYVPLDMMSATNDFYDFMDHNYDYFADNEAVTLTDIWRKYKDYCEYANAFRQPMRVVQTELENYFENFQDRTTYQGKQVRHLYSGFLKSRFERGEPVPKPSPKVASWLDFKEQHSVLDDILADAPAQESKEDGSPLKPWSAVTTSLKDICTSVLHWVNIPESMRMIVIDFDIYGEDGEKSLEANLLAASKWPMTYAELSKSGKGIHLHYIYDGDPNELSRIFEEHVEIKVFTGNAALRRLLTKCNDIPVAVLTPSPNLPKRGGKRVVDWDGIKNAKMLKTMILRNLKKEYHSDTTSSVDYIKYLLDQAYEAGIPYDMTDIQPAVLQFAMNSTNQASKCVATVAQMKFKSEEKEPVDIPEEAYDDGRLVFFDCEVYINLFVVAWKYAGDASCVKMINPKPWEVEELFRFKLVGFNCRQYDNHILLAAARGYSNEQLYKLSQDIIVHHTGFFSEAYNISYTDVLDFCTDKMSLKKWEIELDIHHQEMAIPWDQPAPEDRWAEIAGYCENDVIATEAVFNARKGDFMARQIQVDLVNLLHGNEMEVAA